MAIKRKLTSSELIQHMIEKGITFELIDDDLDPEEFISKNNYYYKFASYRHNFTKNAKQEYVKLDFKHLQELSTIDMHLRKILLQICINIEHSLKVNLLNSIENNNSENGYDLVHTFINEKNNIRKKSGNTNYDFRKAMQNRASRSSGSYNTNILNKYQNRDIPIWVLWNSLHSMN